MADCLAARLGPMYMVLKYLGPAESKIVYGRWLHRQPTEKSDAPEVASAVSSLITESHPGVSVWKHDKGLTVRDDDLVVSVAGNNLATTELSRLTVALLTLYYIKRDKFQVTFSPTSGAVVTLSITLPSPMTLLRYIGDAINITPEYALDRNTGCIRLGHSRTEIYIFVYQKVLAESIC